MKNILRLVVFSSLVTLPAFADPIVDIYQDMESGSDGNVLTASILAASSHGSGGTWNTAEGNLYVSTDSIGVRQLPMPVIVDGVTYRNPIHTHSWMVPDNTIKQRILFSASDPHSKVTVSGFLTIGPHSGGGNIYDAIVIDNTIAGIPFTVAQIRDCGVSGAFNTCLEIEAYPGKTLHSPDIRLVAGKTYWISVKFDGVLGLSSLSVFDPDNNFSPMGPVSASNPYGVVSVSNGLGVFNRIRFGRVDDHYVGPNTKTYFSNLLIDWTNASFPLLPSGVTTEPKPSAPTNLRVSVP